MTFLERAALLGHDVAALQRGETVTSEITIDSIERFREIFAGTLTEAQRNAFSRSAYMTDPNTNAQQRAFLHYIYGSGPLPTAELADPEAKFTAPVSLTSAQNYNITEAKTCGPFSSGALNAGTLTFSGGGSITALSSNLSITADTLVIAAEPPAGGYHIGIQGVPGTPGMVPPPAPQYSPNTASAGSNAGHTSTGCKAGNTGGNGGNGNPGDTGTPGGNGNPGNPNEPATITINSYDQTNSAGRSFIVAAQAGAGGAGARGGQGGKGQNGGNGGNGCHYGISGTKGGPGGNAGVGGQGGMGGAGGDGAQGVDYFVTFPSGAAQFFPTPLPQLSGYGLGGAAGPPGAPGSIGYGGAAGGGIGSAPAGPNGSTPNPSNLGQGLTGPNGNPGTISPSCQPGSAS